jgi:predicted transcriptional regulator
MGARCETIGKFVLPVFRSLVAKELVNTYHFTQVEAAQKLGTTQAAISQYINSKRAFKETARIGNLKPRLQAMACETARRLAKGEMKAAQVTVDFCKLCPSFPEEEVSKIKEDFAI